MGCERSTCVSLPLAGRDQGRGSSSSPPNHIRAFHLTNESIWDSGFGWDVIQDSGWRRSASDGVVDGSSGSCGQCGSWWGELPLSGGTVWGICSFGCAVDAALSAVRLGATGAAWWRPAACPECPPGLYPGADRPGSTPDLAWPEGRTGGAWGDGIAQCGMAVHEARGAEF